jgi:hypothetical protein
MTDEPITSMYEAADPSKREALASTVDAYAD